MVLENLINFHSIVEVKIPDKVVKKIQQISTDIADMTNKFQEDFNHIEKRFFTGFMGEAAVEIVLKKTFIDWTVGPSKNYTNPDLMPLGLDIGIKTVTSENQWPLIKKLSYQIICVFHPPNIVWVCGLATPEILDKYSSSKLVKSYGAKLKNKRGFFGYKYLLPFKSWDELIKLCKENNFDVFLQPSI